MIILHNNSDLERKLLFAEWKSCSL